MKKLLFLLMVLCLGLGTVTVSAEELSVHEYRDIYLDFARKADIIGSEEYANCFSRKFDGMIMLDLNCDNVPELLTYIKEETVYNEAMEILTPGSNGYDNPYYVSVKYYLKDALSIIEGNVVSFRPWFDAGREKGMPMAYLPDEVPELPTELATFVAPFDGKLSLFSLTTDKEAVNALSYENGIFEFKSEEYSDLDGRIGEERGVAVSIENPENSCKYDQVIILLDKYESELNKVKSQHTPVVSDWAKEEINAAIQSGVLPEKMYYDNLTHVITRAEFAACVVNAYEKKYGEVILPENCATFDDIKNHKYEEEIKKACYLEITNGIDTGIKTNVFFPDAKIAREDIATMFCRAYKKANCKGWTLSTDHKFPLDYLDVPTFADDSMISNYAKSSVYFMAKNGIVKGIGENRFAPNWSNDGTGYATRQEAVIMALRFLNCTFA